MATPPNLSRLSNPVAVRNYMAYQQEAGRMDLYWAGFRRLAELEGGIHASPLDTDFWRALIAGEELLHRKHGKRVLLARTRQKIGRAGILQTVEDLVLKKTPSEGFALLVGGGLWDLTAEALAIKHKEQFSETVVDAARKRLQAAGVVVPGPTTP